MPGGSGQQGKQFTRSEGGEDIVFKHRDLFVIGMFESGYHPVLNIRYRYLHGRTTGCLPAICKSEIEK